MLFGANAVPGVAPGRAHANHWGVRPSSHRASLVQGQIALAPRVKFRENRCSGPRIDPMYLPGSSLEPLILVGKESVPAPGAPRRDPLICTVVRTVDSNRSRRFAFHCRLGLCALPLLLLLTSCQTQGSTPRQPQDELTSKLDGSDTGVVDLNPDSNSTPERVEANEVMVPEFREPLYTDLREETRGTAGGDFDCDVSPDGSALVFSSTRYSKSPKIFMRDSQGAIVQKTSGPQHDIQPKFSPDGKWIAFASDREGNFDILVVSAHRNEAYLQVTRSEADEIHPTWSPDGRRLAFSSRADQSNEWNLMIVSLDDRRVVQLGLGLNPEWSPDGTSLAFQRPSQRGPRLVWRVDRRCRRRIAAGSVRRSRPWRHSALVVTRLQQPRLCHGKHSVATPLGYFAGTSRRSLDRRSQRHAPLPAHASLRE